MILGTLIKIFLHAGRATSSGFFILALSVVLSSLSANAAETKSPASDGFAPQNCDWHSAVWIVDEIGAFALRHGEESKIAGWGASTCGEQSSDNACVAELIESDCRPLGNATGWTYKEIDRNIYWFFAKESSKEGTYRVLWSEDNNSFNEFGYAMQYKYNGSGKKFVEARPRQ